VITGYDRASRQGHLNNTSRSWEERPLNMTRQVFKALASRVVPTAAYPVAKCYNGTINTFNDAYDHKVILLDLKLIMTAYHRHALPTSSTG